MKQWLMNIPIAMMTITTIIHIRILILRKGIRTGTNMSRRNILIPTGRTCITGTRMSTKSYRFEIRFAGLIETLFRKNQQKHQVRAQVFFLQHLRDSEYCLSAISGKRRAINWNINGFEI